MDLYLIASNKTGIPYLLKEIFPGSKLKPWLIHDKPLKGRVKQAVEFIKHYFADWRNWQLLPFTQVQKAICMRRQTSTPSASMLIS